MRRRAALAAVATILLAACANQGAPQTGQQPVRLVFFEDDSIALGPSAVTVIQDAAGVAARAPTAPIRVLGFIAPDPTIAPTVSLSRARAERVAAELARFGVPRERITVQGRGTAAVAEAAVEARRVEILIGSN